MGANGSFANGWTATESGRRWQTVHVLNNGTKVIELKNKKGAVKLPEESHSPNSIYAIFNKNEDNNEKNKLNLSFWIMLLFLIHLTKNSIL